ncbi:UNVERIFIED_CONTAM: hypothetical protein PYX00_000889 [Menopon gallinae]|uniref:Uncharacterized protein n=1 Tax=Menopon gallinae TaxID=328185 RepID=A0AAW2IC00_9NEOP
MKESSSVITLNPLRFEPEDSPELRRITYNRPYKSVQDILESEKSKTNSDRSLQTKTSQHWKNAILRKASIRSKRAPLAGGEEITPSLRSSWSSVYFNNNTPTDSDSDNLSYISDAL